MLTHVSLSRPQLHAAVAAWPPSAPCCRSTPAPAQLLLGGGASRWRPGSWSLYAASPLCRTHASLALAGFLFLSLTHVSGLRSPTGAHARSHCRPLLRPPRTSPRTHGPLGGLREHLVVPAHVQRKGLGDAHARGRHARHLRTARRSSRDAKSYTTAQAGGSARARAAAVPQGCRACTRAARNSRSAHLEFVHGHLVAVVAHLQTNAIRQSAGQDKSACLVHSAKLWGCTGSCGLRSTPLEHTIKGKGALLAQGIVRW
jgi:hypothetical protein